MDSGSSESPASLKRVASPAAKATLSGEGKHSKLNSTNSILLCNEIKAVYILRENKPRIIQTSLF